MVTHHTHHRSSQKATSATNQEGGDGPLNDASGREPEVRPGISPTYQRRNREENKLFTDHLLHIRFIGYVILVFFGLAISFYITSNYLKLTQEYSKETGFVSPFWITMGNFVTLLIIAYVAYRLTERKPNLSALILAMVVFYLIAMVIWYFNLSVRVFDFGRGSTHRGHGGPALLIMIAILLVISVIAGPGLGYIVMIPVIWNLYIVYNWWFIE